MSVPSSGFGAHFEDLVLGFFQHAAVGTGPATAYMALLSALPTDGATVTETDYASYARKSMTMATIFINAPVGNSPAVLANAAAITLATATGDSTLNVVGWAIFDASTGGNLLAYGPVGTPAKVTSTSTPNFAIGALTISVQ